MDPSAPRDSFRLTYNCVGVGDNAMTYNDGWVRHVSSSTAGVRANREGHLAAPLCVCVRGGGGGSHCQLPPLPLDPPRSLCYPPCSYHIVQRFTSPLPLFSGACFPCICRYHIVHHLNGRLHWTELPTRFAATLEAHAEHDALCFVGTSFFQVGCGVDELHRTCPHATLFACSARLRYTHRMRCVMPTPLLLHRSALRSWRGSTATCCVTCRGTAPGWRPWMTRS